MKLYHDTEEQFFYLERDGKWFESLYDEESEWIEIPAFHDIEHAGLITDDIYSIDLPEWMTDCEDCGNHGWIIDDGEIYECGCYWSKRHNSYENFISKINFKTMRFHNV